jgi:hypothetical protein
VTVRGQVIWPKATEVPVPEGINVAIDKQHCCGAGPMSDESLVVDPKTRGVRWVVVWLRQDDTNPKSTFPKERIHPDLAAPKPVDHTIEMPRCQFVPRVIVARAGDSLTAKNAAPVAHNVRLDGTGVDVNRLLPAMGESIKLVEALKAQAMPVPVRDSIHPWMGGYVRIFDHPYFAVTAEDGSFEMPKVPAGKWRIVYWHEKGYHQGRDGRLGFPIEIRDTGAAKQTLPPVEFVVPK